MNIQKDISELITAGVITKETAEKIQQYYAAKEVNSSSRIFIIFGVLGAALVGLGVILIIAHNWDSLSKTTKTALAFLPLLASQVACGFTLLKKPNSTAWRESSSILVMFTLAATIAMVGQIYNIPGDLRAFIFVWLLLSIPLIYIMDSSITSLLCLIVILQFSGNIFDRSLGLIDKLKPLFLFSLILPFYFKSLQKNPIKNATIYHNWLIPIGFAVVILALFRNENVVFFAAYISLFACYYLIGNSNAFSRYSLRENGFVVIGSVGTIFILIVTSFQTSSSIFLRANFFTAETFSSPSAYLFILFFVTALALLLRRYQKVGLENLKPVEYIFILFTILFLIGLPANIFAIIINIILFATGILTIRDGIQRNHLMILNYGMLIIAIQTFSRFVDSGFSFVGRGLLFIAVGIGFFIANYYLLKKRRENG